MKKTLACAAIAAAFAMQSPAFGADAQDIAALRAELAKLKQDYEARLTTLEQRLQQAEDAAVQAQNAAQAAAQGTAGTAPAAAAPVAAASAPSNTFNPDLSLVLGGTLGHTSQDPESWRIGGFLPGGDEAGPAPRGFALGESELTLSANVDPRFAGRLTFALTDEGEAEVEEAYMQTRALPAGLTARAGRFLSAAGYLNPHHAHTWDFADAPLAYDAFFGGQYKVDGLQARWLAPTDTFVELGMELGTGAAFPGTARTSNGFGSATLFATTGGDIGDSSSWSAGLAHVRSRADGRGFDEDGVPGAFSGRTRMWIANAVYKWAPDGNPVERNFKLQGEYLRRTETGTLSLADTAGDYDSRQSGWYVQGVYQFMRGWRTGLRYDRLSSGTPFIGSDAGLFPSLAPRDPSRASVMLDYSPSEFSRLRLQYSHDKARGEGAADRQIYLQYIMSLGAHAAHSF